MTPQEQANILLREHQQKREEQRTKTKATTA